MSGPRGSHHAYADVSYILHQCFKYYPVATEAMEQLRMQLASKLLSASDAQCKNPTALPGFKDLIEALRLSFNRATDGRQRTRAKITLEALKASLLRSKTLQGNLTAILFFSDESACVPPTAAETSPGYQRQWLQRLEFLTVINAQQEVNPAIDRLELLRFIKGMEYALTYIGQAPSDPDTLERIDLCVTHWLNWAQKLGIHYLSVNNHAELHELLSDTAKDLADFGLNVKVMPEIAQRLWSGWSTILDSLNTLSKPAT
jgi:hypothetical protein